MVPATPPSCSGWRVEGISTNRFLHCPAAFILGHEINEPWSLIRGEYNFDLRVLAHYRRLDPIAVYIFTPLDLPSRADPDLQPVIDLERETPLLISFRAVSSRGVDSQIFDPGGWNRSSVWPIHYSLNAVFSLRRRQHKVIHLDFLSIVNSDDCRLIDIFHARIVDLLVWTISDVQTVKPYAERIPARRNGFEFV